MQVPLAASLQPWIEVIGLELMMGLLSGPDSGRLKGQHIITAHTCNCTECAMRREDEAGPEREVSASTDATDRCRCAGLPLQVYLLHRYGCFGAFESRDGRHAPNSDTISVTGR